MATFQGAAAGQDAAVGPIRKLTLADAQKGGSGLPSRIVFYGPPGVGKTSFAAYAPSPIFILSPGETGVQTLIDAKLLPGDLSSIEIPEVFGWIEFLGIIDDLTKAEHDHKTIVIDTINGIEKLANSYVCETEFEGNWEKFSSFGRGPCIVAAGEWLQMLAALDRLRVARKVRLILLSHSTVSTINNPSGYDYSQYRPAFDSKACWERTCEWSDMVLFGNAPVKVEKGTGGTRGKAKDDGGRMIYTEMAAGWVAKNRHGLPWCIRMGDSGKQAWDNVVQALRDGRAAAAVN